MIVSRELRGLDEVSDVLDADSAEAAIEVLQQEPVDLILCDWNMGGMTGLEFLQALRAAEWTVPFGFITSEASDAVLQSARAAGAAFHIAKPFTADDLANGIRVVAGDASAGGFGRSAEEVDRPSALAALLEGLVRRPVSAAASSEAPPRQSARWTASYVDPDGADAALCVVETPLAAALSAALLVMPPAAAAEWAGSGALPDALSEGFHEVTNVLAHLVRADGARCILKDISGYAPGEQLPDVERIKAAPSQESFRVHVEGYAGGLIALVSW